MVNTLLRARAEAEIATGIKKKRQGNVAKETKEDKIRKRKEMAAASEAKRLADMMTPELAEEMRLKKEAKELDEALDAEAQMRKQRFKAAADRLVMCFSSVASFCVLFVITNQAVDFYLIIRAKIQALSQDLTQISHLALLHFEQLI